jgi:predicted SprT family Zn-dependent metalloprotease
MELSPRCTFAATQPALKNDDGNEKSDTYQSARSIPSLRECENEEPLVRRRGTSRFQYMCAITSRVMTPRRVKNIEAAITYLDRIIANQSR